MIKMILTDGDGTLWEYNNKPFQSSWDALPESFPPKMKERWFSMRDAFFNTRKAKVTSYSDWFDHQLRMLKGHSLSSVEKFLFPIPYSKGARNFFLNLKTGHKKGIVSSGVNLVADRARDELGMNFSFSNVLNVKNGRFTGDGNLLLDLDGKADVVRRIAKDNNTRLSEICFVGDNENDLPVLEIVGRPIAFNPKDPKLDSFHRIKNFNELKRLLK